MKLFTAVLLLLAAPVGAQTIAPAQIKPGTNGQSMQTVGGKAAWGNSSTSVPSVFGRTGAITPQTGDYNCSQITSAVCSLPSLFNQTVSVDGAAQTQRAKLNFINGSAGTVSCVDNPVTAATDCTFTGGSSAGITYSIADVTGSRAANTAYQNTSGSPMYIAGSIGTSGSGVGNVGVAQGLSSFSMPLVGWANQATATVSGGDAGFSGTIMPGYWYTVIASGAVNGGVHHWIQITSTGSGGGGGGGAAFPGSNGVVFNTSTVASRNATYSDIVGLWTSCTSGWLKFDGSCSTPSGGGPNNFPGTAHQFVTGYNSGTLNFSGAQPAFADISGTVAAAQLPLATSSVVGAVKCDGTSITCTSGVIAAVSSPAPCSGTTCILVNPTLFQTINQPSGTYLNPNCTNWGTVANANDCIYADGTFTNYVGDTGRGSVSGNVNLHDMFAGVFNPGWGGVIFPADGPQWQVTSLLNGYIEGHQKGIQNGINYQTNHWGLGDSTGLVMQLQTHNGFAFSSDEGVDIIRGTIDEIAGPTGTVATGGSGATTVTASAGMGRAGVGQTLIDTSTGGVSTTQTLTGSVGSFITIATTAASGFPVSYCGTLSADMAAMRQPNNATTSQTFQISNGAAYSGSATANVVMVGNGGISRGQLTSIGAYSGGLQTFTGNFYIQANSGSNVCVGGLVSEYEKSAAIPGEYYVYVVGSTSNTLYLTVLLQGNPNGSLARAGAVTIYKGAEIKSVDTTQTIFGLTPNDAAWTAGDAIEQPNYIGATDSFANLEIFNQNPVANVAGLNLFESGVPIIAGQGSQMINIWPPVPTNLVSQGGTGYAPTTIYNNGVVGAGQYFAYPPSDAFRLGNPFPASLDYVECNGGGASLPNGCAATYYLWYDHNVTTSIDGFAQFTRASTTLNYADTGGGTFILEANGHQVCDSSGGGGGSCGGSMVYPPAGIPQSTGTAWGASLTAPASAILGLTDVQAPTHKNLTDATNTFPTFNQNTTGTAANVTGIVAPAHGGLGIDTSALTGYPSDVAGTWGVATATATFSALYKTVATSLGDIIYGGASGAPTRLAGPTSNALYALTENVVAGAAVAPGFTALAASATTDTTNASNIGSGTIGATRLPAALSSSTSVNGTTIPASVTLGQTVANGTAALGTSAIASGACATTVTVTATGVATTDVVGWGFNGDPTAVTGYTPTVNGMLTIIAYPSSGNVNFKVCNNTAASVTPGAITLNWRVGR